MSDPTRPTFADPPRNLNELLLRDVASLLVTSQLIGRSVKSLRPQCQFSGELAATLDQLAATTEAGEQLLHPSLAETDALPEATDARESRLLADFFIRLPVKVAPGGPVADVTTNLRLLAQHVELKARLAADEALLAGQRTLGQALELWAAQWQACAGALRRAANPGTSRNQPSSHPQPWAGAQPHTA